MIERPHLHTSLSTFSVQDFFLKAACHCRASRRMPLMGKSSGGREVKVLEGVTGNVKSEWDDKAWVPSDLVHEPPLLNVTQPKGSFCTIEARFQVALDPDGVYDIITDPNNRRVFKNIKEVTYRKVLEDDGNRQLVEVEQLGRWKFLMFSGSFASRVIAEQNRQEHTLLFDLAKQGMMRKFSGSWKLEPMRASESDTKSPSNVVDIEDKAGTDAIIGSWVNFQQVIEPTVKPPWPLNNYVRGISERIIREMLADLQRECLRLSEEKKQLSTMEDVNDQK